MNVDTVTGRDHYVIERALAYAIAAIESLPITQQEWSDKEDMRQVFENEVGMSYDEYVKSSVGESILRKFPARPDGGLGRK